MDAIPNRRTVKTRDDLLDLLFLILDHNDAVKWQNETVCSFLQAMAAWLDDAPAF